MKNQANKAGITAVDVYAVLNAAERGLDFYSKQGTRQHYEKALNDTRSLIEYAPELLAACEGLLKLLKDEGYRIGENYVDYLEVIAGKLAVKKAKGL